MAEVVHLTHDAAMLLAAARAAAKAAERDPAQHIEWTRAAAAMRERARLALRNPTWSRR